MGIESTTRDQYSVTVPTDVPRKDDIIYQEKAERKAKISPIASKTSRPPVPEKEAQVSAFACSVDSTDATLSLSRS